MVGNWAGLGKKTHIQVGVDLPTYDWKGKPQQLDMNWQRPLPMPYQDNPYIICWHSCCLKMDQTSRELLQKNTNSSQARLYIGPPSTFFVHGKYCVWLVGKLATFNLIKYMKFRASYLFIWHRFLQMLFFQLVEREQSIMKLTISAPFSVDTSGTVLLCHFKFEHYDACGGRRATTTTLGRSPSDRFETSGFNHY